MQVDRIRTETGDGVGNCADDYSADGSDFMVAILRLAFCVEVEANMPDTFDTSKFDRYQEDNRREVNGRARECSKGYYYCRIIR